MTRATITTAHLLRQYRGVPGIRPFSFICVLPGLTARNISERRWRTPDGCVTINGIERPDLYTGLKGVTFYAPYSNSFEKLKGMIRRSDTHEVVDIEHKTLNERLHGYFMHREHKSYPPDGVGLLQCWHIQVLEHVYIGKEMQEIKEDTAEESGYVIGYENTNEFSHTGLSEVLKAGVMGPIAEWSRKTGIPERTLRRIRAGATPTGKTRKLLIRALITPTMPGHWMQLRMRQAAKDGACWPTLGPSARRD